MTETGSASGSTTLRFHSILFATDFSGVSSAALPYAAAIARRFGATIHVAHVIPAQSFAHIPPPQRDVALARIRREAEGGITQLLASSHFKGIPHDVVIDHGELWPVLSSLVETYNVDLIVEGTRGKHGLEKLFSGSAAEQILRLAVPPVLAVGSEVMIAPEAEVRVERLIYVTDFLPHSRRAMNYAYALAKAYSAQLYFLHVVEDVWTEPRSSRVSAEEFFGLRLRENGWPETEEGIEPRLFVEFGSPESRTLEMAQTWAAQLIVIGVSGTGHPDLSAHLPGPLAYNIATHARCPVLVVRGDPEEAGN